MKKFFFCLMAMLTFMSMSMTFAQTQDTIWLYNVDADETITFEAGYSFNEVESLIMSSRVAYLDDAEELVRYYFEDQGIKNVFWRDAAQRYIEWPDQAEAASALGEYYHPKSIIYVPNDDYVNAIVFDWSSESEEIYIAIFCEDGLWTSTESLGDKWAIFIDSTFAETIHASNTSDNEP